MKRLILFGLFLVLCVVQWFAPGAMIMKREMALQYGERYLVKTAPIDPYDAFRGRYVWLSFQETSATVKAGDTIVEGQRVYVTVTTDEDGFAHLGEASSTVPLGTPYIPMRAGYTYEGDLSVIWPIDRFYMEESIAPQAEAVYRDMSSTQELEVFAAVRVSGDYAVIENLYVGDTPIAEYVLQNPDPADAPAIAEPIEP